MLEHGGELIAAARRYGISPDDWLDLSTGINPLGWPVPPIPPELWARLPQEVGLSSEQFARAVEHAPATRPERYTILERLDMSRAEISKAVEEYARAVAG